MSVLRQSPPAIEVSVSIGVVINHLMRTRVHEVLQVLPLDVVREVSGVDTAGLGFWGVHLRECDALVVAVLVRAVVV